MPRKSMKDESAAFIEQFFDEAAANYMKDVMQTRQPSRRRQLLAEADALDKVKARFYNWLNGKVTT